jgi:hypothetical protein
VLGELEAVVTDVGGEIDHGLRLRAVEAGTAESLGTGRDDRVDGHGAAAGIDDATVDGGGGTGGEQLMGDRAHERGEAVVDRLGATTKRRGTGQGDDRTKGLVAFRDEAATSAGVEFTW